MGEQLQKIMNEGALVPSTIMQSILRERLRRPDALEKGWLLDGTPRTESEAQWLFDEMFVPSFVLMLNVNDEVVHSRLSKRRIDPETGAIYNLKYKPPPHEIAHRVVQRSDDVEEVVQKRIDTYYLELESVISKFQRLLVKEVDTSDEDFRVNRRRVFAAAEEVWGSAQAKEREL